MAGRKKAKVVRTIVPIVQQLQLTQEQKLALAQQTPVVFVKQRPTRGGKVATYVEGGYVVSRLNAVFNPLNWNFDIIDQGQTERTGEKNQQGEVWVKGQLCVLDHKNGYRVCKTQYGQHNIYSGVPLGDAFKAASTDSLKKCASYFGIAHDVYWKFIEGDEEQQTVTKKKQAKPKKGDKKLFADLMTSIQKTNNLQVLETIEERLGASELYTAEQKQEAMNLLTKKLNKLIDDAIVEQDAASEGVHQSDPIVDVGNEQE